MSPGVALLAPEPNRPVTCEFRMLSRSVSVSVSKPDGEADTEPDIEADGETDSRIRAHPA